jgi:hypothetical protein
MTSGSKRVLEKGQIERKDSYGNSTEGQSFLAHAARTRPEFRAGILIYQ